jgi:uncharacterized membrane protein YagU involved in acid resistance
MKNETHNNTAPNLAVGALAGIIGGFALAGAAQSIYSLTSAAKIAEETAIEPRDPFIVLAEKLEKLTGRHLDESQKKIFEQCAATALGATAGVSYAWLASKWNLNWLLGGLVFGGIFWAVEDEGISPLLGLVGNNTKYPLEAHVRGLAAHIVFGIVTAAFVKAAGTENE